LSKKKKDQYYFDVHNMLFEIYVNTKMYL